jgi:hypothetical protein
VGPRTGVDDVERRKTLPLTVLELRAFGLPARSHSPYRLRSPGSNFNIMLCLCIHVFQAHFV